ncbi:MAG TPA: succinylglutamate desuccinylase/aspartoacylase family protein [Aliidongia sp.]|nr:succinylglutamate desuccinylase/aspartoacylase family protein [Aliidongia sp.]
MTDLPAFRSGRPRSEQGFIRPLDGVEIPFGMIEGDRPGPVLLVTAGVHGSEYCSIESALRTMRRSPEGLSGTILVLPILNMGGFRNRSIYVMPEDGRNLNRMFPGKPDGSFSERLAHWLVTAIYPQADAYLDLHCGDLSEALVPFCLFPSGSEASRALATAFGLPVAISAGGEGYTINASGRLGVPSIIAEVGGNGLWDEAGVGMMMAGIDRVLSHLGMIAGPVPRAPQAQPLFVTMTVPAAATDGLWYPAKGLSAPVGKGEVLGDIRDLFGAVRETVHAPTDGVVLYRLSSLAVNKGEALLGIGTPLPA